MTKEDLLEIFNPPFNSNVARSALVEFFHNNVVIPKGTNRHPDADVWHEAMEDLSKTIQFEDGHIGKNWTDLYIATDRKHRIKPQEPVYEYKVCMYFQDGSYDYTNRYFTVNEHETFGFPKTCTIDDATKRERK